MFRRSQLLVLVLIAATGCDSTRSVDTDAGGDEADSSSRPADASTAPADAVTSARCEAPATVASVEALMQQLQQLSWAWDDDSVVSGDVQISGELVLRAEDVPVPAECAAEGAGCRQQVSFWTRDLPGVSCRREEALEGLPGCAELSLKDTTVRFRPLFVNRHPGYPYMNAFIELVASCDTPCGDDEIRCDAQQLCMASFDAYCGRCLGKEPQECTCHTLDGPMADGTECMFVVGGDMVCMGHCEAGMCRDPDAAWEFCR